LGADLAPSPSRRLPATAATAITSTDYPSRVTFSLLQKLLDDFTSESWSKAVGDTKLAEAVRKYQDPRQADTIMKVQQELDETKIVLVRSASCISVIPTSWHRESRRISRSALAGGRAHAAQLSLALVMARARGAVASKPV
jgi:hypothetical protein